MGWNTPKTDWDATDGVPNTELNKMGENFVYLANSMYLSGNAYRLTLGSGSTDYPQTVSHTIDPGWKLVLVQRRFSFVDTDMRLRVQGGTWGPGVSTTSTSTLSHADELVGFDLEVNVGGAPIEGFVRVGTYNSGGSTNSKVRAGWWVHVLHEPI